MLLANDDNEITHLNDRLSDFSGSDISLHTVKNRCCFCCKRSVRISWEEAEKQVKK